MSIKETKKGILDSENYERDIKELRKIAEKIKKFTKEENQQWTTRQQEF